MNVVSVIFCAALLALPGSAAPFVEVEAVIDVTSWHHNEETGLALKNSRSFSVRCVIGTNAWLIENFARTNIKESVWFVNGRIIRQSSATQDPMADDSTFSLTRRGGRYASITASEDGYPASDMFLNLPWFAFCSGPYLKHAGRSVPLPAPDGNRSVFGFKDQTVAFTDPLALPQRVELFTSKAQLRAKYEAQQSTNVLGWNFPTAFTLLQNEPDEFDQMRRQLNATGHVTRIRPASSIELPQEIQARLELLERYPSRRR
jgi:hypothetical protein